MANQHDDDMNDANQAADEGGSNWEDQGLEDDQDAGEVAVLAGEWGTTYPLSQQFLAKQAELTAVSAKAIELLLKEKVASAPSGSAHSGGAPSPTPLVDVRSLIHRPSLFSGEHTEKEDVRFWLKTVERAVGGIITDSHAKASYMGGCPRGRAQTMYESLIENETPSFEELSAFLIKHFGERNVEHLARQKLLSLRMKEGDLTGYTSEFMRHYSMCIVNPVNPADAIEFYHRGLTDELQSALRMDPATKKWWSDLTTLMDSATLEYAMREGTPAKSRVASVAAVQSAGGVQMNGCKGGNGSGGGKKRRYSNGKGKGAGKGSNAAAPASTPASGSGQASGSGTKRSSKPLQCYTCGGPHVARECPKRYKGDQASEVPPSADEPTTSGRVHPEQSCACHTVGAEMISELEGLSGHAFTESHAPGRRHVLIFDPEGDVSCELVRYLRVKQRNVSSMSGVVIAPENKRHAGHCLRGCNASRWFLRGHLSASRGTADLAVCPGMRLSIWIQWCLQWRA